MSLRNNQNLNDAKLAASRIIRKYEITSPEEIRLEAIAKCCGILVREEELEGAEARLIRSGDSGIVRINRNIPEVGRKRFAIAHELGHWTLHQSKSSIWDCSSDDMMKYSDKNPLEVEANTFASELLMPSIIFRPECRKSDPSLEIIIALAQKFNTSITATSVRFVQECKEPCLVVFSEDGRVRWWKSKEEASSTTWIDHGQKIHTDSAAWDCLRDGVEITKLQKVQKTAWFQNLREYRKFDLYEQAMKLRGYDVIISLLWLIED